MVLEICVGVLALVVLVSLVLVVKKLNEKADKGRYCSLTLEYINSKANNTDRLLRILEDRFNRLPSVKAEKAEQKMREAQRIIDSIGEK